MGEDFRLKWNDHHSIFFSTAERLCHGDNLTDVTLSCGNKEFSAHKLVLSICSSYFSQLFNKRPDNRRPVEAIVYLKDVDPRHMELLLNFMYRGEINVEENELMGLLATAKGLQIKGLTDENEDPLMAGDPVAGPSNTPTPRPNASSTGKKRPASNSSQQSTEQKKIKQESAPMKDEDSHHEEPELQYEDESEYLGNEGNPEEYEIDDSGEAVYDQTAADNSAAKVVGGKSSKKAKDSLECRICFKTFKTSTLLRRHGLVHSGSKPFECQMCSARFGQKANLKRHCLSRHVNKGKQLVPKNSEDAPIKSESEC